MYVSDGNSYKFGSSRSRGLKKSDIIRYLLVGGRKVVGGRQLFGRDHTGTSILGSVNLLLNELGRRFGCLQ